MSEHSIVDTTFRDNTESQMGGTLLKEEPKTLREDEEIDKQATPTYTIWRHSGNISTTIKTLLATLLTGVLIMTYAYAMTRQGINKVTITNDNNYPELHVHNLGFTNLITNEWKLACQNAKPGLMVIIKEDNLPPTQWKIGKIVKVYHAKNKIVRVAGRLQASKLSFNDKHPILLPARDNATKLIMIEILKRYHHVRVQTLLAITRHQPGPKENHGCCLRKKGDNKKPETHNTKFNAISSTMTRGLTDQQQIPPLVHSQFNLQFGSRRRTQGPTSCQQSKVPRRKSCRSQRREYVQIHLQIHTMKFVTLFCIIIMRNESVT